MPVITFFLSLKFNGSSFHEIQEKEAKKKGHCFPTKMQCRSMLLVVCRRTQHAKSGAIIVEGWVTKRIAQNAISI
jgi:hypothetical protein